MSPPSEMKHWLTDAWALVLPISPSMGRHADGPNSAIRAQRLGPRRGSLAEIPDGSGVGQGLGAGGLGLHHRKAGWLSPCDSVSLGLPLLMELITSA